ncbi:MAG TPA: hypothetical protein VFP59_15135 [Candidatus Angelobacter sp.]|nr:hypothetical protein [Candidatus Angelobacter sp.]
MAEPLHRSSDLPSFDTYPSGPELAQEQDRQDRLLPEEAESSPLEEYGAQLGSAAGQAVLALRRAQARMKDLAAGNKAKVTDIASARVEQVRDEAEAQGEKWGRIVRERSLEWRRRARNGIYRARLRAREIGNDRPAHVVIGAGVLGVVIGAALRIWRASRG